MKRARGAAAAAGGDAGAQLKFIALPLPAASAQTPSEPAPLPADIRLEPTVAAAATEAGAISIGMNCDDGVDVSSCVTGLRATVLGASSPVRWIPLPTSQLRSSLTFKPRASATAATYAPGCWHSARTCDWNSAPCTRLWNLGCIGAGPFRCP